MLSLNHTVSDLRSSGTSSTTVSIIDHPGEGNPTSVGGRGTLKFSGKRTHVPLSLSVSLEATEKEKNILMNKIV